MCSRLFRATPRPRTPTGGHLVRKPTPKWAAGTSRANRSAPRRYGNTPQRAPSLNQALPASFLVKAEGRNDGLRLLIARGAKEEQGGDGRNDQTDDDRGEPVDPPDMDVEHQVDDLAGKSCT